MLGRLRHDSEQQAEAVARLGEGLNAALRQMEAMSGAMETRQDRMRRTLDERMELMNQSNERRLAQMQALPQVQGLKPPEKERQPSQGLKPQAPLQAQGL